MRHKTKQRINSSHFSTFVVRISPWSEDSPSKLACLAMNVMVTPLGLVVLASGKAKEHQLNKQGSVLHTVALACY